MDLKILDLSTELISVASSLDPAWQIPSSLLITKDWVFGKKDSQLQVNAFYQTLLQLFMRSCYCSVIYNCRYLVAIQLYSGGGGAGERCEMT